MRMVTPASFSRQDKVNKSIHTVLSGNVCPGNGLTFDVQGQPLTYSPDNMIGTIIRIGQLGNPNALEYAWTANNTDLTIAHNLNSVPYGFIVIAKWLSADVWYGTVPPDATNITLQTNNDATDITIWILASPQTSANL